MLQGLLHKLQPGQHQGRHQVPGVCGWCGAPGLAQPGLLLVRAGPPGEEHGQAHSGAHQAGQGPHVWSRDWVQVTCQYDPDVTLMMILCSPGAPPAPPCPLGASGEGARMPGHSCSISRRLLSTSRWSVVTIRCHHDRDVIAGSSLRRSGSASPPVSWTSQWWRTLRVCVVWLSCIVSE